MKKIALFALAALCTAAAQAVTIDWAGTKTGITTAGSVTSSFGLGENETATIAATITYGAFSNGSILSFSYGGGTDMVSIALTGSKEYRLVVEGMDSHIGNQTIETGVYTQNNATDIISLHITRTKARPDNNQTGRILAVDFYVNGELAGQLNSGMYGSSDWGGAYTHEGDINYISAGTRTNNTDSANGSYDMDVYYANATIDAADVHKALSVPEPTALALLALGVAGLALKRKNA